MKKLFLLAFSGFFACTSSNSQSNRNSFIPDSLDNYVNNALKDWQIPGAAVAIIKNDKVVFIKGYGVKEMGTNDKVDENTLFMIGSNTKAFTATALAILHAEQKLNLDDKVQKWLPDFKLFDPWVAKEANIRDLLCHRLGFETFQGDFMFFDSDLSTAEVRDKMSRLKPNYSFRSKWGYTNSAFMIAGEIIPKVTGQSWDQYIIERIFKPLGMNNSLALSKDIKTASNKAAAHTVVMGELRKIPYGNIDNLAAAGSISSSLNDLSKWVKALLEGGKLDGKEIIPPAAIAQTRIPHSILGNGGHQFNKAHFGLYGLGWFMEEYAGRKIVAHTGGVNGFVTSVCLIPEERLGIIVFTNTDANGFYEALRNEIQDACLDLPFRNYSKVFLDFQKADEKETAEFTKKVRDTIALEPATALPLRDYAGNYVHEVYGNMNISLESNQLIMRFEHHKGRLATLSPLGGNRFFSEWNDPIYGKKRLTFTVENARPDDPVGRRKVKSLTVRVADFVEFTTYEFVKLN